MAESKTSISCEASRRPVDLDHQIGEALETHQQLVSGQGAGHLLDDAHHRFAGHDAGNQPVGRAVGIQQKLTVGFAGFAIKSRLPERFPDLLPPQLEDQSPAVQRIVAVKTQDRVDHLGPILTFRDLVQNVHADSGLAVFDL